MLASTLENSYLCARAHSNKVHKIKTTLILMKLHFMFQQLNPKGLF